MWPFPPKVVPDTTENLYIDPKGLLSFPLDCDDTRFNTSMTTITDILRVWSVQDINYATNRGIPVENTLLHQLSCINLKFLPFDSQKSALDRVMLDNDADFSGSRLMDAITRIYIQVPPIVVEVFRGRFLWGMIYGITSTIHDQPLPTKEQWITFMMEYPWSPFLTVIQHLYDEDDVVRKVRENQSMLRSSNVQVARVTDNMGGHPVDRP